MSGEGRCSPPSWPTHESWHTSHASGTWRCCAVLALQGRQLSTTRWTFHSRRRATSTSRQPPTIGAHRHYHIMDTPITCTLWELGSITGVVHGLLDGIRYSQRLLVEGVRSRATMENAAIIAKAVSVAPTHSCDPFLMGSFNTPKLGPNSALTSRNSQIPIREALRTGLFT